MHVPDRARVELTFEDGGQVFAAGGVNRLRGTRAVHGDRLTSGPIATTLLRLDPAGRASHLTRGGTRRL